MGNINFVPDDYVQNSESRRTNLIYIVLFGIVMAGLGGSFLTIKIRQKALQDKEDYINKKMVEAKVSLQQFEQLQTKRKEMMKTALTTADLIESVPRSVLIASLTNNLPFGMSLAKVSLEQKEPKNIAPIVTNKSTSKYDAAKEKDEFEPEVSREKLLETNIAIEGLAPSDLQVAAFIERLGVSPLFTNVALIESREYKVNETAFRYFKLTAMVKKDVHLSKEDIDIIREKHESIPNAFNL
ncbi:MAG: PilN domain-containing protein [Phycisphaerae bacterium]|nr:PilN domain-containing protein [Phycisphaerae bacterium]